MARDVTQRRELGPLLPPPPQHEREDRVNDLGWLSRGPKRRFDKEAEEAIRPLLASSNEEVGLPPDPLAPPPLPAPPPERSRAERRGSWLRRLLDRL